MDYFFQYQYQYQSNLFQSQEFQFSFQFNLISKFNIIYIIYYIIPAN
jgi:hypothetical protein